LCMVLKPDAIWDHRLCSIAHVREETSRVKPTLNGQWTVLQAQDEPHSA
jgi:hypothetical protein